MANYSIDQCLQIAAVPEPLKAYLRTLKESRLPNVNGRVFTATNQTALVTLLNSELQKYNAAKEKRNAKQNARNQCFDVLKTLIGGKVNGATVPQIISATELLPKLQEFKASVEAEKKFVKIDKALESTGMTKEQLIEYLQGK